MGADQLTKDITMQEILAVFPGAQRALFSRYHIGGCSSCGFQPTETLEQVGASHNIPNVEEVVGYLEESRALEREIQIRPEELSNALKAGQKLQLLDVRAPEEHKIARIDGAQLASEALAREVVERWPKDTPIVVRCHLGERSVEAAFFLMGQGFTNVRSLTGGIDAWSAQVDPTVPRYAATPAHSK